MSDINSHVEAGRRLAAARKAANLTQTQLAVQLGKKQQKDVSHWENGVKPMPPEAEQWLREHAVPTDSSPLPSAVHAYSYPKATFGRLWEEARKRVRSVSLEAEVRPSKTAGFADALMTITFRQAEIPVESPLYLDCLGVPAPWRAKAGRFSFSEREGSVLHWMPPQMRRARVEPVADVRTKVGPHALGYRILGADREDDITVRIRAERGLRMTGIESIGMPVYPDCPVWSLSVCVKFKGIKPKTQPTAQIWTLRRTVTESRPFSLASGLETKVVSGDHDYAFSNLAYPKAGFGYCIAWDTLEKS